jgi:hypothetical protein
MIVASALFDTATQKSARPERARSGLALFLIICNNVLFIATS